MDREEIEKEILKITGIPKGMDFIDHDCCMCGAPLKAGGRVLKMVSEITNYTIAEIEKAKKEAYIEGFENGREYEGDIEIGNVPYDEKYQEIIKEQE